MSSAIWIDVLNLAAIFTVYAVSVNLLVGWAGVPAVVPTAFGAVGGYIAAYLVTSHGWATPWAALAGLVAGGIVGLIFSGPSLRLSEEYVILLTFAGAYVVVGVIQNVDVLGGPGGLFIPELSVFGVELDSINSYVPWLVGAAFLSYLLVRWMGDSVFGVVLKGLREDPLAVGASGFSAVGARTIAFTTSAALSGFAGVLYVFYIGVASPGVFGFTQSILLVTMVIIGGLGRPFGPVIGAALITLTPRVLQNLGGFSASDAAQVQQVIFGVLLIVVIIWRPEGLLPEIPSPLVRRFMKRQATRFEKPAVGAEATAASTTVDGIDATDLAVVAPPVQVEDLETQPAVRGDSESGAESVLTARALRKAFGGLVVANGFDFDLPAGQVVGLVGPNGAGKTTLFNLLTGAVPPDSGSVALFGKDITGRRIDEVVGYGMVRTFQDVRLITRLTVLENVLLGAAERKTASLLRSIYRPRTVRREVHDALERASAALRMVSMEHKSLDLASSLSFGEQKLVALARAIATNAEVLLLDEPAAGVGTDLARQILALIERLGQQGRTILLVEHNLDVVRDVATSVYYLESGMIKAHGTYEELTSNPELAASYFGTMAEEGRVAEGTVS